MIKFLPKLVITIMASSLLVASVMLPEVNLLAIKRRLLLEDSRLIIPADYRLLVALNQYRVTTGVGMLLTWDQSEAAIDLSPTQIGNAKFTIEIVPPGENQDTLTLNNRSFSGRTQINIFDQVSGEFVPSNLSNLLTLASYFTNYQRGISSVTVTERLILNQAEVTQITLVLDEFNDVE